MKTPDELKLLKFKEEISGAIHRFERKLGQSVNINAIELYSDTKEKSLTIRAELTLSATQT